MVDDEVVLVDIAMSDSQAVESRQNLLARREVLRAGMLPIRNPLHEKADNSALLGQVTQKLRSNFPAFDPLIGVCFGTEKGYLPGNLANFTTIVELNRADVAL